MPINDLRETARAALEASEGVSKMTDATDGLCPQCRYYQPIIWSHVKIAEVHASGDVGEFEGVEMRCRICAFEITKIGTVSRRRLLA